MIGLAETLRICNTAFVFGDVEVTNDEFSFSKLTIASVFNAISNLDNLSSIHLRIVAHST